MKFLVAIHRPDGYDGATESPQMGKDIDALNDAMEAAGVRIIAMGLKPTSMAKSIREDASGSTVVTDGPYLETKEFVGGFWILDCASADDAVEWGRKAVVACKAPVEVRPFW